MAFPAHEMIGYVYGIPCTWNDRLCLWHSLHIYSCGIFSRCLSNYDCSCWSTKPLSVWSSQKLYHVWVVQSKKLQTIFDNEIMLTRDIDSILIIKTYMKLSTEVIKWLIGALQLCSGFDPEHWQRFPESAWCLCCIVFSWKGRRGRFGSWIYNYLCHQYISPLTFWVWILSGVLDTALYDKVYQWLAAGQWFSPGTPVSSTNKTDRHDIAEIDWC